MKLTRKQTLGDVFIVFKFTTCWRRITVCSDLSSSALLAISNSANFDNIEAIHLKKILLIWRCPIYMYKW